jgi:hypothetical protein
MRFGDDWPGVFIRGDNAFAHALAVKELLDLIPKIEEFPFLAAKAKALMGTLQSCGTICGEDPDTCQQAKLQNYLFEVDVGGASYWLASREPIGPGQAQAAIEAADGCDFGKEGWEEISDSEITSVKEARGREITLSGDEPETDMWSAAQAADLGPVAVIACSEWP